MNAGEHLDLWRDRLLDAIDAPADAPLQAEVREHVTNCPLCHAEQVKLVALHHTLKSTFADKPVLSADFSARVLAHIESAEQARKAAARARAEVEFRRRVNAVSVDWRELWQRHAGSIVAALTAVFGVAAAFDSLWDAALERVGAATAALPWAADLSPIAITVVAAVGVGAISFGWLRSKTA